MRVLNILTSFQEDRGLRLIEVKPKVYELRNKENETILISVGELDRKFMIKEADEYLRGEK
jgi:hypothetical protein